MIRHIARAIAIPCLLLAGSLQAGTASEVLPATRLTAAPPESGTAPVANAAFAPSLDAATAPPFEGELTIAGATLAVEPALNARIVDGRDAQRFPPIRLGFLTLGQRLVPLARGRMVAEETPRRWRSTRALLPTGSRVET